MNQLLEIAQRVYEQTREGSTYTDLEAQIQYRAITDPILLIPEEKTDSWGEPLPATIHFMAYVRGRLFAEDDSFSEVGEPEIFIRAYYIDLKVDDDEIPKLQKGKNILGYYFENRKALQISEQLYRPERFIEILEEFSFRSSSV